MGRLIPDEVRAAASQPTVRLAVGLADGISSSPRTRLAPVLDTPTLRLLCHEGEHDALLAELALHHLDLVLAGKGAPSGSNLRVTSERLVASPVDWYGPAALVTPAARQHFPQCLADLPVLLPTAHSALRARLDLWLEGERIVPRVAGNSRTAR